VKEVKFFLFDCVEKFEKGVIFETLLKEKAIEAGIYYNEKDNNHLFFKAIMDQILKSIGRRDLDMNFQETTEVDLLCR
jgi:hypothetical protein